MSRRHRPTPLPGSGPQPPPQEGDSLEEVPRVLRKLVFAAAAAGALAAVRRRSGGRAEADLWAEATRGPQAVSTPTAR